MAFSCTSLNDLIIILKSKGDKLLDASAKLSLSASLLYNLNQEYVERPTTHKKKTVETSTTHCDKEFLLDIVQKTLALKLLPDSSFWNNEKIIDVNIFKNLKLLEVQRLSFNLIKGLKNLRNQLEYIACARSLRNISDVLENCGADNCQGFVWRALKKAAFNYNCLDSLDSSLEFVPCLQALDLGHNRLQCVQLMNCLPNLNYLNLSYNKLESVPSISGQLCARLKILILNNNLIDDIGDLSTLINLNELDLSYNCLFDHFALKPLVNLPYLMRLSLRGNPLCFHWRHRANTAYYLHFNVKNFDFYLDEILLNKAEKQLIGSVRPTILTRSHLNSVCSTESENTIIDASLKSSISVPYNLSIKTSSSTSTLKFDNSNRCDPSDFENFESQKPTSLDYIGMQDSGIVAERRPNSPAELSIGSATSLTDPFKKSNYESDIEVISNPSQSSIEVIRTCSNASRFTVLAVPEFQAAANHIDLPKRLREQHRSL